MVSRQRRNDLHTAAAIGTESHIDTKHPGQKYGPGQTVTSLPSCEFPIARNGALFLLRTRYDLPPIGGVGRQHAMVTHQIQPRRRHQRRHFLDQLFRGKQEVGGAVGPQRLQGERHRLRVDHREAARGQRRADHVIPTQLPLGRIGDLVFYGIPGELLCWYDLNLKARSRYKYPFLLGLANDRIGYIADRIFPTKDIFNVPLDFENRPFGQTGDAGEKLVQAALKL